MSGLPCKATAQIVIADSTFKQHLASAQLQHQTKELEDASEWEECELLRRLVRVNEAQHRRADYFSRLRGVVRCMSLHERLAAAKYAQGLAGAKGIDVDTSDTGPHRVKAVVPSREQAVASLLKLQNSAVLCTKLVQLTVSACELLFSQIARSFFVPFCMAAAASCARIRVKAATTLLQTISVYNVLLPLSAAFPLHARGSTAVGDNLPESLGIRWSHGVPKILVHSFSVEDGYKQLVEVTALQYKLKHYTQATTASVAGSTVRIEHVMATKSKIEENLSLPVFASTQLLQDSASDVKFSLPELKCFQRAAKNRDVLPHTISEGAEGLGSPINSPGYGKRSTEPSKPNKASDSPSKKALRKSQSSGVAKPAVLDWKAVLNKQRKGKQTNTPVKVSALEDVKVQPRGKNTSTVPARVEAEGQPQQAGKQARPTSKGTDHDFMSLLMQGSNKP